MITRYAGIALTFSAMFLVVMAVLVNSPMLFYMATAIIVTLAAAKLQAYLAVRYLKFERFASPAVRVGETVTVEIVVWSERELKRPLVTVRDEIPKRLVRIQETPSLPVAPSFDQPIKTRYSFRPMRRGRYRWERLTVIASDALGLVLSEKTYHTDPVELVVYPNPLPVNQEISPLMGWGASDLDSGKVQGAGLEPRGVREYVPGDPLRYVHWKSSAKRGDSKLMVKEFETGSGVTVNFILQRTRDTDIGDENFSTFEAMCSHSLFLATDLIEKGAMVRYGQIEPPGMSFQHPELRLREVRELLTDMIPDEPTSLASEVSQYQRETREGETVVIFVAVQDPDLPEAIMGWHGVRVVVLAYDSTEYNAKSTTKPASDPLYLARLEQAGAHTIHLPRQERLSQ
ncbi:MAG: DUF58 domain-containing protein [Armatimonadetes bacterium]|nr:DUF58 domain-containing protein [Armatimonadota bacterium]